MRSFDRSMVLLGCACAVAVSAVACTYGVDDVVAEAAGTALDGSAGAADGGGGKGKDASVDADASEDGTAGSGGAAGAGGSAGSGGSGGSAGAGGSSGSGGSAGSGGCSGPCAPGATKSQACGNCGTQTLTCDGTCQWSAGPCTGEGVCHPGDTHASSCGNCGTQTDTCDNTCHWQTGACSNQGACSPGQSQTQSCDSCGNSQQRTCSGSCQWGAWSACGGGTPVCSSHCCAADEYCSNQSTGKCCPVDCTIQTLGCPIC